MKSLFEEERKVYMIACGNSQQACKVYDMKPNVKGIDILDQGRYVCTYSERDMKEFTAIGFAVIL